MFVHRSVASSRSLGGRGAVLCDLHTASPLVNCTMLYNMWVVHGDFGGGDGGDALSGVAPAGPKRNIVSDNTVTYRKTHDASSRKPPQSKYIGYEFPTRRHFTKLEVQGGSPVCLTRHYSNCQTRWNSIVENLREAKRELGVPAESLPAEWTPG